MSALSDHPIRSRDDASTAPRLRLLGEFAVFDGERAVALPRDAQRLLAYLAMRGRPVSRSLVAGNLWLDHDRDRAQGNLRSAVWRVRQQIGSVLECDASDLAIAPATEIDVDVLATISDCLMRAPAEWTGEGLGLDAFREELLAGWYDDWVIAERERIRQLSLHALEAIADRLVAVGHHGAAAQAALYAIEMDPLRESSHRCLIRVHLAEGNRSEALRQFGLYRQLLGDELGIAPSKLMLELIA
jgi:DNA-binding SARP family transcriptional activator